MKKLYILPMVAACLLATGCSKENGFDSPGGANGAEGQFLKSALSLSVDEQAMTRDASSINVNDFKITFTKTGATVPTKSFNYGDMPDVVTLPAGEYNCIATYGQDLANEWENPYYYGVSNTFEVTAYDITSDIDPIVCSLGNVMVTVEFDPELRNAVGNDAQVEVKVGENSRLVYDLAAIDANKAGYFKHTAETSLVALFTGNINGESTTATKSCVDIQKGCHYNITFRLRNGGAGGGTGELAGAVQVDASVEVWNVDRYVEIEDDPTLDDSERPTEEDPSDPGTDPEVPLAPSITAEAPVDIDGINMGADLTACVLNIHSYAAGGITEFTCMIDSEKLTTDELAGIGLTNPLDLVNLGSNEGPLTGLGLVEGSVAGLSDVKFDLTKFLTLLGALGSCEHKFILTVTDANGTTEKTLILKY